jgi:hypothetical protein
LRGILSGVDESVRYSALGARMLNVYNGNGAGKLRPDSRHIGVILRLHMSIVFNGIWIPTD